MNVLGWDCWGGDAGIRHANVVELGVTPKEATVRLLDRAALKYGPQDWTTWDFRAEPVPKTSRADVIRFRYEAGGIVRADVPALELFAAPRRHPPAD